MPELVEDGLPLQAVFHLVELPAAAHDALSDIDLAQYETLVLLGQAGSTLWERHVRHQRHLADPFDEVVQRLVAAWFDRHLPAAAWTVVYPGRYQLPLGQLAAIAGWGTSSPLGLSIHPEYGPWIAHRLAFLTSATWSGLVPNSTADHPCDTCHGRPCERACPVGAVSYASGFDVATCARFRAQPGSICAYRCLAREACPIGTQYRYVPAQMHHHYAAGLTSIRRWLEGEL